MDVIIAGTPVHLSLIDIMIAPDLEHPDNLNAFFCPYCRNPQPLFQFQGRVVLVAPGHAPIKMPIIKRCSNCKRNYALIARDI